MKRKRVHWLFLWSSEKWQRKFCCLGLTCSFLHFPSAQTAHTHSIWLIFNQTLPHRSIKKWVYWFTNPYVNNINYEMKKCFCTKRANKIQHTINCRVSGAERMETKFLALENKLLGNFVSFESWTLRKRQWVDFQSKCVQ